MNRKEFIKTSALGAALLAVPSILTKAKTTDDDWLERELNAGRPVIGKKLKLTRPIRSKVPIWIQGCDIDCSEWYSEECLLHTAKIPPGGMFALNRIYTTQP